MGAGRLHSDARGSVRTARKSPESETHLEAGSALGFSGVDCFFTTGFAVGGVVFFGAPGSFGFAGAEGLPGFGVPGAAGVCGGRVFFLLAVVAPAGAGAPGWV